MKKPMTISEGIWCIVGGVFAVFFGVCLIVKAFERPKTPPLNVNWSPGVQTFLHRDDNGNITVDKVPSKFKIQANNVQLGYRDDGVVLWRIDPQDKNATPSTAQERQE
jgi:hypothetical protein